PALGSSPKHPLREFMGKTRAVRSSIGSPAYESYNGKLNRIATCNVVKQPCDRVEITRKRTKTVP
ncbi:MAG: hypothetical protein ACI82H_000708, partial [Alphaproteobacteria bacterium]